MFWVKEKDTPIEFLPSDFVHESYNVFRKRALEKRNLTAAQGDRDMDVLYQFWSHFLVQNFNAQMYNDFRSLALDDISARYASYGFNRFIHFYGASLSSNKVLPDEVVRDLVDFGREESTSPSGRIVFQTLRSAWQSRSFNPRTRKKIDCVLDASLRAELEK
ncbi:hypothetical protein ASPWEDRAFT_343257 [Aspergillus wentii DTO 134E9]|uniref:Uncharacterized protein n=1 Tax=Aspergillus wentii DTO 134E9 TaxID=1073089 RepID=A0A1L9RV79_ASPWE|nr:uncharacterized protein ASPWEDRAFT_343257 [Aspergillus wentii DTO 134E9]KAI9928734.1 hypothetical protein MW887_001952 [Aspergillus wentii]OJJ38829.1 hypothetical protein ASPWEDRAFT_343257 [Aspergillus wentii DTO 134E9]